MPVIGRLGELNATAVLARTEDGLVGWRTRVGTHEDARWSEWTDIAPTLRGQPVVLANQDRRLEMIGWGPDGRVGHCWQSHDESRTWSSWESLGPEVVGAPAAAVNRSGGLEAFAVDGEGRLGHAWQRSELEEGHGWSEWHPLAERLTGAPAVFANANRLLEVFAIDADGALGHIGQVLAGDEVHWMRWAILAADLAGRPAAYRNADGHLDVFVKDGEGWLGNIWQYGPNAAGGWSGWSGLKAQISGEPVVGRNIDGRLEVFARGTDGLLGHLFQNQMNGRDGWSAWKSFDVAITGDPAVVINGLGELDVYAITVDGRVGHYRQDHRTRLWRDWEDLGAVADGSVVAAVTFAALDSSEEQEEGAPGSAGRRSRGFAKQHADVCVIGAGPAGVALTEALVGAGASVVLVESGNVDEISPQAERLNRGATHGPVVKGYWRYMMAGRRRTLGGAASMWGPGMCIPFLPLDLEQREWVDLSGWPLDREEIGRFEQQAARFFGFEPFPDPEPDGKLVRIRYRHPPDPAPWRSIFARLLREERFHVALETTVLELAVEGDRVTAARCGRFDGSNVVVNADRFVLATGGIENARFLLHHAEALPHLSPMVGRCFMEHPHAYAGRIVLPKAPELQPLFAEERERVLLTLPLEVQAKERILLASVELRPHMTESGDAPQVECDLFVRSEQAPNPESAVALGLSKRDHFGQRPALLNWNVLPLDWHSIVRTAELVSAELANRYGEAARLAISEDHPWPWEPAGPNEVEHSAWGNHHMGTTRMADDPEQGVVDRDCRLHGLANLYVAGSSVFPTASCANPTFMLVALAQRLAAHLSGAGEHAAAQAKAG